MIGARQIEGELHLRHGFQQPHYEVFGLSFQLVMLPHEHRSKRNLPQARLRYAKNMLIPILAPIIHYEEVDLPGNP